ncbi:MAG: response regulator [Magnetococcales bacterium]|nr:response regulator [Magnetococcales bacterium]
MSKVLIVDDNETEIRSPLVRQLGRVFGPENILGAANGAEALSILRAQSGQVGVIVLDIMMPVMDGISTCRAVRSAVEYDGVYIAMLTGRDGGLPEGLEVGANVYLRKPCQIEEMIAVVKRGLAEFEKYQNQMADRTTMEGRLYRVEVEKEYLQRANAAAEVPPSKDPPAGWLDWIGR